MVFVGQLAQYMHAAELRYGFLSNYDQTVFVKVEVVNGQVTLLHSRAIQHDAVEQPRPARQATVLQCFVYIANLAANDHAFMYPMPPHQWAY